MVVRWYDLQPNSLATRVRIPLWASGIRDTFRARPGAIAAEPTQPNQRSRMPTFATKSFAIGAKRAKGGSH